MTDQSTATVDDLFRAIRRRDVTTVERLVREVDGGANARREKDGQTALGWACIFDAGLVAKLIEWGADVNAITGRRAEPIINFCVEQCWSPKLWPIIELVLAAGAKVTGTDRRGRVALHAAAYMGPKPAHSERATRLLIAHGADVRATDVDGKTPLHLAVTTIATATVDRLLEAGADVNAVDARGRTPLHHLVGSWIPGVVLEPDDIGPAVHRSIATALIARGAGLGLRDSAGLTPRDLATRVEGYPAEVAHLLVVISA